MSSVSSVVPVLKNVGDRFLAKNYCPISLISAVSKILQIIGLLITWRNVAYFLIASMVLGRLNQL